MAEVVSIFKNKVEKECKKETSPTGEVVAAKKLLMELVEYCANVADGHRGNLQVGDMIRKYGSQAVEDLQLKKVEE